MTYLHFDAFSFGSVGSGEGSGSEQNDRWLEELRCTFVLQLSPSLVLCMLCPVPLSAQVVLIWLVGSL